MERPQDLHLWIVLVVSCQPTVAAATYPQIPFLRSLLYNHAIIIIGHWDDWLSIFQHRTHHKQSIYNYFVILDSIHIAIQVTSTVPWQPLKHTIFAHSHAFFCTHDSSAHLSCGVVHHAKMNSNGRINNSFFIMIYIAYKIVGLFLCTSISSYFFNSLNARRLNGLHITCSPLGVDSVVTIFSPSGSRYVRSLRRSRSGLSYGKLVLFLSKSMSSIHSLSSHRLCPTAVEYSFFRCWKLLFLNASPNRTIRSLAMSVALRLDNLMYARALNSLHSFCISGYTLSRYSVEYT